MINGKFFESEVANYYKLEKKFLTTPFYPRPHNMPAIFSGLTPLEMENSFRIGNDPEGR
jgi:hypothetical protein